MAAGSSVVFMKERSRLGSAQGLILFLPWLLLHFGAVAGTSRCHFVGGWQAGFALHSSFA